MQFFFFPGERQGKEGGMPKASSDGTNRGAGPQIPPGRTHGWLYHFSQGVGAIPDVGLLEVDLPEPAGVLGSGSPFQRQRAGEKKGETATAAEENPCWEALGQGLQGGHGSQSEIFCPSRLQTPDSALMWEKAALAPRRAGEAKWEQHKGCKPYLCCGSGCALQEVSCTLYRATNIPLSCFFFLWGTGDEIKMTSASLLLSSILFWELPNHFKTHKYKFKAIIIISFL